MEIPFIDLKTQYQALKPSIDARIQAVLDHGQYIMGPEVAELEAQARRLYAAPDIASRLPAVPKPS
jgi:dTDP-4-amino-4,6-dideoxygalactose transaminase